MQEQPQQPDPRLLDGTPEEEQQQHYKTLAVRLDEATHAQLRFIAQLGGSSISEEIRRSIEARLTAAKDDPDLITRAEAARAEIERQAAARSAAIAGFLGQPAVAEAAETQGRTRGTRRKTPGE